MTTVIAAGAGKSFPGVVPDAQLVLVKVSNYKRQIKERDIERGLAWILANHRRFGIRIVNISVGGDDVSTNPDHPLHRIVQQLAEEGVITVVAAGNFAAPILLPPASAPLAITVGGLDDQNSLNPADWLPYGSNWGVVYDGTPKPEVIAPARWIASPLLPGTREAQMGEWLFPMVGADEATVRALLRQGYAALGLTYNQGQNPDSTVFHTLQRLIHKHKLIDSTHQHVDGTSVSAPIVAATIAQMLETHPGLDVHEVRALLTASADILPGIPAERQGGGLLNPLDAVKRSQSVPETALAHGSG
jgi:serine protease AprX